MDSTNKLPYQSKHTVHTPTVCVNRFFTVNDSLSNVSWFGEGTEVIQVNCIN